MFNINKIGIVWTTAFIAWSLAFILEGEGIVVHVACMIGQTLLLFLSMWLIVKQQKQQELFMEEWRKEIEEREEYKNFRRQVEEYKDGMA